MSTKHRPSTEAERASLRAELEAVVENLRAQGDQVDVVAFAEDVSEDFRRFSDRAWDARQKRLREAAEGLRGLAPKR